MRTVISQSGEKVQIANITETGTTYEWLNYRKESTNEEYEEFGIQSIDIEITDTEYIEHITYNIPTFDEIKAKKGKKLHGEYMSDISWTDDALMFWIKIKELGRESEREDWWNDIINYWNEARTERENNKIALAEAVTIEEIKEISYSPTHVKTREEIEGGA